MLAKITTGVKGKKKQGFSSVEDLKSMPSSSILSTFFALSNLFDGL